MICEKGLKTITYMRHTLFPELTNLIFAHKCSDTDVYVGQYVLIK
uniref:Uncharacterized protein n=1 Tax=Anguilla anguilla TaxID=7936 RepID=A0A0E9TEQ4_ANGAN